MLLVVEFLFWTFVVYSIVKTLRRKIVTPDYSNKTVWITGASSGIGEYLAYQFSKFNANLIISARNRKQLERVKQGCVNKSKVQVIELDMSNFEAVEKTTLQTLKIMEAKGQKLDVIIQNAGISMRCQFKDYNFKNHLSMFDVNVNGPFRHIQTILPHMVKNKGGQIVGITSIQAKLATAYRSSYAASKHALLGILDSLRSELADKNIAVTNILPGYIKTNISKNALGSGAGQKFGQTDLNIEKGMDPEVFAKQTVRAIYRKEKQAAIYDGFLITAGIFIRNLCPDLSFFGLRGNMKNQTKAIKRNN